MVLPLVVQVVSRSGKTHYVQLKSWLTQRAQHAFALEAAQPILTESDAQEGDSLVLSHLVPGTLVWPHPSAFFHATNIMTMTEHHEIWKY